MRRYVIPALVVCLSVVIAAAFAQVNRGTIAGVVTDAAHLAVAGAQITVAGTRLGGVSDLEGRNNQE